MTALTASYLANESFKSSSLVPTVVNGTKSSKNQECKLEFVDGGILEPPPLPPNVIKLSPNEDLKNTSNSDAASVSNSTTSSISLNNNNGNGSKSLKRKRQFSERFEKEAQHLVIEKQVSNLNSWDGCKFIKNSTALAGIRNPHNNCFLNSVLQAISHIPQFGRYILEHHVRSGPKCSGYDCMLCSLKAHILRGINWDVNDASWINKFFDDIFPSHQRGSQEDAHEMLLFLLDAIDRQQQKISRSQPGKISSIVEQVFDGKVRCEYTCMTCQKKSICYEPIRGLSVELPKQVDGNFASMSRIIKGFFNDERIAGYDCKQCKKKTVANKRTRVVTAPNVLIIQLKRFLRYSKINDLVLVCKELSLTDIMHNNDDASYKLLGYIRHIGGSMSSGHYTAVFTGFDGKPYVFDDEQRALSQVTFVKPLQPYILFYARNPSTNKSTTLIRSSSFQSPAKKQNYNGYNGNGNYSTPIKNNSLNMKNQILTPTKNENGHGNGNIGTFKTNSWTSAGFIGPIHPNKNGENSGTGFSMKITNGNRNIFNGKTNGIFKNENDIEKQNTNEKNDEEEKKEIAEKSPGNIENTNPNEENLKSNEKPPETSAIPESYFNFIKSQKPTKFVQD